MTIQVGDQVEYARDTHATKSLEFVRPVSWERGTVVEVMELFPQLYRYLVEPTPVTNNAGQQFKRARVSVYAAQIRKLSDLEILSSAFYDTE